MRRVEVVEDPRSQRCWVVVDMKSGEPVMRLHDRGLLERVCNSLEWKVVGRKSNTDAGVGPRLSPCTPSSALA
jgi:hypothetical protein